MSQEETPVEKTTAELLSAVADRLKTMEHHSRNNLEHLGADWFLIDDQMKNKELGKAMEPLLGLQNKFQEEVTALITKVQEASEKAAEQTA